MGPFSIVSYYCLKCESASRRFQPGEGPNRGLLRDCTTSPINRFAALLHTLQPVLLPAGGGPLLVAAELLEAAVGGEGVAVPRPGRHRPRVRAGRAPHDGG